MLHHITTMAVGHSIEGTHSRHICNSLTDSKGKAIPGKALWVPGGWVPKFHDNQHMKVVRSALRTYRLYPPRNIPGIHFCSKLESIPKPKCGRKDYINEKSNDTTGNRTRDLPACRAVPQPTAPRHAPLQAVLQTILHMKL